MQLSREMHMDVDIIMRWSLDKIYEHMAFYMSETPEWKEQYAESLISPEQKAQRLAQFLGGK